MCPVCVAENAGSPVIPIVGGRIRVCSFPGCGTHLNRYNKNRMCSLHGGF